MFLSLLQNVTNSSPMWWLAIAVALYLICVSGYNDWNQPPRSVSIFGTTETFQDLAAAKTYSDLQLAWEFALLSSDAYKEKSKKPLCNLDPADEGWYEIPTVELPSIAAIVASTPRWHLKFYKGLSYSVYIKTTPSAEGEHLVAIAFTGTNQGRDFWSNAHWITRWIPFTLDQYDAVRIAAPELSAAIRASKASSGKRIKIVTTGHSLGGGLAQQMAYAADGITTVYAFDSTSVTGYFDVPKPQSTKRATGMRIYRIHERGEILAYMRLAMRNIFPVRDHDPQIVEARYNFENLQRDFVSLHSIEQLACNLRELSVPATR
jgi:hypothetical protein